MNEYVFIDPSPAPGLTHDEVRDLVYSLRARVQELERVALFKQDTITMLLGEESGLRSKNTKLTAALQDIRDNPGLSALGMRTIAKTVLDVTSCKTCRGSGWVIDHDADGNPTCQADCPDCNEPAKHPDTERLDWLDARSEPVTYEDAPHATAWHIETEPGERIDLRAAIDAARKEVQP